jgi:hypothetical protein
MLLALLLFIGAAGLIFAYFGSADSAQNSGKAAAARTGKFEGLVNKHLMYTNDKVELQRQRIQVENAQALSKGGGRAAPPQVAYSNDGKLDLSSEDHASEIAKELGRGPRRPEFNTPEDIVQQDLYNAQQAAEYNEAYREEYARQFVENARRGGYKVILSEDLSRVMSVTPIRNPGKNSFDVFGSGTDAIQ